MTFFNLLPPFTPRRLSNTISSTSPPCKQKRIPLSHLDDDVLLQICTYLSRWTLKNLSLTSRHLHALLSLIVFKKIHFRGPEGKLRGLLNGDWACVAQGISILSVRPPILSQIKSVHLDIWGHQNYHELSHALPDLPPNDTDIDDLLAFLSMLPCLETLIMPFSKMHAGLLRDRLVAFDAKTPLRLSNVQTLAIDLNALGLIDRCPHVKTVIIDYPYWQRSIPESTQETPVLREELVKTLKRATQVIRFEDRIKWTESDLRDLAAACPQLECLNMRATETRHGYASKVSTFTKILGEQLPHLKRLEVIDASMLDVSPFRFHVRTGSAASPVQYPHVEDEAARLAFDNIKSLEMLWVGHYAVARRSRGVETVEGVWERSKMLNKDWLER